MYGPYHGFQDELMTSLRSLQKKGELLQEEKLILLRRQQALPLGTREGAPAVVGEPLGDRERDIFHRHYAFMRTCVGW